MIYKIIILLSLIIGFVFISTACEPVSNSITKTTSISTTPIKSSPIILKENFLAGSLISPSSIPLNKVRQWAYSSSQQITFNSTRPPYVVNAAIRNQTSKITTSLNIRVYKKGDRFQASELPITSGGRQAFIIKDVGDYIIDVQSVGCEWWMMIGNETEGYRE